MGDRKGNGGGVRLPAGGELADILSLEPVGASGLSGGFAGVVAMGVNDRAGPVDQCPGEVAVVLFINDQF